jgi:mercuric ion transport protein
MVRGARYLYLALAWAFLVGLVVQVFFIGLGLFAGSENLALHANLGWILHLAPILILAVAALARAGRRQILMALGLAVTVFIVPILATLRSDQPVLAALHPVGALLAFWLAILVALAATRLVRGSDGEAGMAPAS